MPATPGTPPAGGALIPTYSAAASAVDVSRELALELRIGHATECQREGEELQLPGRQFIGEPVTQMRDRQLRQALLSAEAGLVVVISPGKPDQHQLLVQRHISRYRRSVNEGRHRGTKRWVELVGGEVTDQTLARTGQLPADQRLQQGAFPCPVGSSQGYQPRGLQGEGGLRQQHLIARIDFELLGLNLQGHISGEPIKGSRNRPMNSRVRYRMDRWKTFMAFLSVSVSFCALLYRTWHSQINQPPAASATAV